MGLQDDEQRSRHRPRNNQDQRKGQHGTLTEEESRPYRNHRMFQTQGRASNRDETGVFERQLPAYHNSQGKSLLSSPLNHELP